MKSSYNKPLYTMPYDFYQLTESKKQHNQINLNICKKLTYKEILFKKKKTYVRNINLFLPFSFRCTIHVNHRPTIEGLQPMGGV